MRLYCYEICDNLQNVNSAIGVNEVKDEIRIGLLRISSNTPSKTFDTKLPRMSFKGQNVVPLFTELGRMVFQSSIENIAATCVNSGSYVKEVAVELSDDELYKIEYGDGYQVYLTSALYDRLKANRYMMCV